MNLDGIIHFIFQAVIFILLILVLLKALHICVYIWDRVHWIEPDRIHYIQPIKQEKEET